MIHERLSGDSKRIPRIAGGKRLARYLKPHRKKDFASVRSPGAASLYARSSKMPGVATDEIQRRKPKYEGAIFVQSGEHAAPGGAEAQLVEAQAKAPSRAQGRDTTK